MKKSLKITSRIKLFFARIMGRMMLTCEEMGLLASRIIDERLPFMERIGFRLHLIMCKWCRHNYHQLQSIHVAIEKDLAREEVTPDATLSPEARKRIEESLRRQD